MTTGTEATPVTMARPAEDSLAVLARIESRRFARHPLFVICLVLLALGSAALIDDRSSDTWGSGVFPAFFLGVFGCVVAYRLTRSTEMASEAIDVAPTSITRRTGALCVACLVPGVAALVFVIVLLVGLQVWPLASWQNPGLSLGEQLLVLAVHPVVACVGGPLVGVAAGRWWRFPGAGVSAAVLLIALVILSMGGRGLSNPDASVSTVWRMFSPYTFFTESLTDTLPVPYVMRWPGSPYGHAAWQVALCGLAAVAALLYGARGETRVRLRRWGMGLVALAVVSLVFSVVPGPDHSTVYWRDGSITNGPSTDNPLNPPID